MATGFYAPDGIDLENKFIATNGTLSTGFYNSAGVDLGNLFIAGDSGITTCFYNSAGVDLGGVFGTTTTNNAITIASAENLNFAYGNGYLVSPSGSLDNKPTYSSTTITFNPGFIITGYAFKSDIQTSAEFYFYNGNNIIYKKEHSLYEKYSVSVSGLSLSATSLKCYANAVFSTMYDGDIRYASTYITALKIYFKKA